MQRLNATRSMMTLKLLSWVVTLSTLKDMLTSASFIITTSRPSTRLHHSSLNNPTQRPTTSSFMISPMQNSGGGERAARLRREAEIRRKISKLKKDGKLKKQQQDEYEANDEDDDDDDDEDVRSIYEDRIRQKLGDKKSKLLGYSGSSGSSDADGDATAATNEKAAAAAVLRNMRQGQLGTLPQEQDDAEEGSDDSAGYTRPSDDGQSRIIDPSLFDDDDDDNSGDDKSDESEEELVDLVAQKMMEKRYQKEREERERLKAKARAALAEKERERQTAAAAAGVSSSSSATVKQTTSGVGGAWGKDTNETSTASGDLYKPKTGSWGAFPRPRDISKAYGGGRRVGPGYSNEEARAKSAEDTRERLRRYREKVGIEVQSEKDYADEIEEALKISGLAMQRGIYATAVSALEKVTKYCSSNSKVGGKVFLELAMAYEAVGRTQAAIKIYTTLSRCRIEEIKISAKRLLYGLEAIDFMKNDVGSKEFSRKKAKNTFIDTTGLKNIAQNFDDVYQTAYVDLDNGFYKKLTESVVRSNREARQVLLQATGAGEVRRQRIVQALRSLSRHFDDALEEEIEMNTVQEDVAVIDGKPIIDRRQEDRRSTSFAVSTFDDFVLGDPAQMLENLNGEWRLQLLADKSGDGVKFFNNTEAWQILDTKAKTFSSLTPSGFLTLQQSGDIQFNDKRRVLAKSVEASSGGGVLGGILGGMGMVGGAPDVVKAPRQVISVDSILLVTRGVPSRRKSAQTRKDDDKDYFAVWRRAEPGKLTA